MKEKYKDKKKNRNRNTYTGGTDTDEGEGNLGDRSEDRGWAEPWKQNAEAGDHNHKCKIQNAKFKMQKQVIINHNHNFDIEEIPHASYPNNFGLFPTDFESFPHNLA